MHGSNTIGATLAPMLMTQFLQQLSRQPVSSAGTGTANETVLSTQRGGQPLTVLVAAHGSSTGYSALAAGQADVGQPQDGSKAAKPKPWPTGPIC
ncbi:hypothetical protein UMZ34_10550 [Halopseudomonas pachastrellae]|nr:hypothetical protein UMZ34_10550 [Halopseudomonas pachastrellae]